MQGCPHEFVSIVEFVDVSDEVDTHFSSQYMTTTQIPSVNLQLLLSTYSIFHDVLAVLS